MPHNATPCSVNSLASLATCRFIATARNTVALRDDRRTANFDFFRNALRMLMLAGFLRELDPNHHATLESKSGASFANQPTANDRGSDMSQRYVNDGQYEMIVSSERVVVYGGGYDSHLDMDAKTYTQRAGLDQKDCMTLAFLAGRESATLTPSPRPSSRSHSCRRQHRQY